MSSEIENPVVQREDHLDQIEPDAGRFSAEINSENLQFEKMDSELRHSIRTSFLDLKITVCIQLSVDEVAGLRDPIPYYVNNLFADLLTFLDPDEPPVEPLHLRRRA